MLAYRERSQLQFLSDLKPPFPQLLLDTTVYIDALQGRLPDSAEVALRTGSLWHSSVTEAELAALAGLLDPAHPGRASAIAQVAASIDRRPSHRILTPDRDMWREAGILAGLLARLQRYDKNEQRKALNEGSEPCSSALSADCHQPRPINLLGYRGLALLGRTGILLLICARLPKAHRASMRQRFG